MKSACKKVYVNKAPRSVAMLQDDEEEKIVPMEIDPPQKPAMASLAPGSGLNASLKGKNVKIVNRAKIEEKKGPSSFTPAPAMKKPAVMKPKPLPVLIPVLNSQFDSNIAEIAMEELNKQNVLATGDPVLCLECNAIFNSYSKVEETANGQIWVCEFCESVNQVHLEPEEIPTESKLVYVLETSEQVAMERQGKNDSQAIIFCIDISGSMCVTQPVSGKVGLKTSKLNELKKQFGPQEGPQFCPREKKNVTYVSRLECVQAAIESHLSEMQNGTPNKKIGIVTFNGEVSVIGDGFSDIKLTGDKLLDFGKILSSVENKFAEIMARPVSVTKEQLCKRLLSLEENGPTALGPALLASVALGSQGGAGSKVILCTDGIANVGLGSLETEEEVEASEGFYAQVGELAKQAGVSISVISIASEECRLDCLSGLVEETGGDLTKVDPENLSNDFANILASEVLACNVTVTVNLHKFLGFRNQEAIYLKKPTHLFKKLGSVTEQTIFTFEYVVNNLEGAQKLGKVPFQVTVDHRKMNGMRCVLVDTQLFEISENQEEMLREADFEVLSRNVQQRTAELVKKGQYSEARKNVDMWQGYMHSNASSNVQRTQVEKFSKNSKPISEKLREIEEEEEVEHVGPVEMQKKKMIKKDSISVGIHRFSKKTE